MAERVPPGRAAGQADHGGIGDQRRKSGVEGIGVALVRHDDRVVQLGGRGAGEQDVDDLGHDEGQHAGRHRFDEVPDLPPDELVDGQGHGQDQQREQRNRGRDVEQGARQPLARAHDVGLRSRRGGAGRDGGHYQHEDLDAGHDAAQPVDRLADPALELIGDLDGARLRWRHGMIVSPGRPAA